MNRISIVAVVVSAMMASIASANDLKHRADKHAPAGLMGDHLHAKGTGMIEYKYMNMYMADNRIGSTTIQDTLAVLPTTIDGTFTNGGAAPVSMTMEMHMAHFMYGLTDDVTIYAMAMLPSLTMDHLRGPGNPAPFGTPFTLHNSGFGDTSIGMLLRLFSDVDDDLILNLGGSVPTGDIFRTSSTPSVGVGPPQALAYPMRLGSGTFNARPGITWKHYHDCGSYGLQLQTDIPIGRNYRGYSVSDTYQLNAWHSLLLTENIALSLRLENVWKTTFDGEDPATPNFVISTNVEDFQGGYWLNLGIGAAATLGDNMLSFEVVPNLYQDLNGIQLETDWSLVASWSRSL